MLFYIIDNLRQIDKRKKNDCYLIIDNWNDWFQFRTLYLLYYIDDNSEELYIGNIKIGQYGMTEEKLVRPIMPTSFEELGEKYFSVGQDENYYLNLRKITERDRNKILITLNDFVYNNNVFQKARDEEVTRISLLRYVSETSIEGQFRRILTGGAKLSKFDFCFSSPMINNYENSIFNLEFYVDPHSKIPSNIHVLIGRNGIGKTTLFENMTKTILMNKDRKYGNFYNKNNNITKYSFSALITISFSAFDNFYIKKDEITNHSVRYTNVGLKKDNGSNKSMEELDIEFSKSLRNFIFTTKKDFWCKILNILQYDPIFNESDIINFIENNKGKDFLKTITKFYRKFSSGHKIVLFVLTKLIEEIEEKTLVLIDEPESHLHPPLLSAYIRALSELLKYKNAVCIVATHSPIILQEVASDCVWILQRSGLNVSCNRPNIESFGESVGILTREVFGFELTKTGFHTILKKDVDNGVSYDNIITEMNDKISNSAKILLSNMIHRRDNDVQN